MAVLCACVYVCVYAYMYICIHTEKHLLAFTAVRDYNFHVYVIKMAKGIATQYGKKMKSVNFFRVTRFLR